MPTPQFHPELRELIEENYILHQLAGLTRQQKYHPQA